MTPARALAVILVLSLCGVAFSGVLTWRELVGATAMACPAPGAPGTIFGYPACVYGFFMFVLISGFAGAGMRSARYSGSMASAAA